MQQNDVSSIERLLADWADWMRRGGSTTDGFPRKSVGATDSRIQSIEDLEIEVDLAIMIAVNAGVFQLNAPQRNTILRRYGLAAQVWRMANEQEVYDLAVAALLPILRKEIVV